MSKQYRTAVAYRNAYHRAVAAPASSTGMRSRRGADSSEASAESTKVDSKPNDLEYQPKREDDKDGRDGPPLERLIFVAIRVNSLT